MPTSVTQVMLRPSADFDEVAAEAEKRKISKAIRPDRELTTLPPLSSEQRRVLLVVPPGTIEESYGRLSAAAGELPMLGLAFIAASLRDQGHIVKIIDYEVNNWPMSAVERDIREFRPDAIGMTAYITNMKRCAQVAGIAKEISASIVTILGGPQVTIFPEEAFHSPDVDMIVLSEGEIVIRNVMNALDDEDKLFHIKGIWFRSKKGEIVKNEREGLVDDLDIFPPPALDLSRYAEIFSTGAHPRAAGGSLADIAGLPVQMHLLRDQAHFWTQFSLPLNRARAGRDRTSHRSRVRQFPVL